jgi:hypothetical protein
MTGQRRPWKMIRALFRSASGEPPSARAPACAMSLGRVFGINSLRGMCLEEGHMPGDPNQCRRYAARCLVDGSLIGDDAGFGLASSSDGWFPIPTDPTFSFG